MKIEPIKDAGVSRTGTLRNITVEEIIKVLGFKSNCKDDPSKVVNSWGFLADGVPCGIWDYKGSHRDGQFSTDGPASVFKALFGDKWS